MNYATEYLVAALKAAREKKAISQRELSARTGVPQANICRLEKGHVDIRVSSLVSLARALDLEVELVPRKALSAIETIVRSTERKEVANISTNEVARLASALQVLRTTLIPQPILEQTLNHLKMIGRFPLDSVQLDEIRKFNKVLRLTKPTELESATLAHLLKGINQLRNQLAHAPPPALPPKPAYSLDEPDNDDGEDDA